MRLVLGARWQAAQVNVGSACPWPKRLFSKVCFKHGLG